MAERDPDGESPRIGTRVAGALNRHGAATLFVVALGVRLIHLSRSPHRDELFHILAARSLLVDGDLVIASEGLPYERGWPFTYLVAGLFRVFGESLLVARLPGVLATAALVALVFWWVKTHVGSRAAWAAALLLCFDPSGLYVAQLGRFYGLHALLFFLGAVGVYGVATSAEARAAVLRGVLAVGALLLAFSLQMTTALGVAALGLWVALAAGPAALRRLRQLDRGKIVATGAALGIAAGVFVMIRAGVFERAWETLRYADDWAEARTGSPVYYHIRLASTYPTLWSLFPVILLISFRDRPRVATFCTTVFLAVLGVASLGAMQSERYIFFVMPFFFALAGVAIGAAIPWLRERLAGLLERWSPLAHRSRVKSALVTAGLLGVLLFAVGSNGAPVTTARMLAERDADVRAYGWQPNWQAAARILQPMADSSTVVASSWPLSSYYHLDRLDLSLHAAELTTETGRLPEFTVPAWYLPRPTISEPGSLARIRACAPSGLMIVERGHWRSAWGVPDDLADYMTESLESVDVPERWGLRVFRWRADGSASDEPAADCPGSVPQASGDQGD